MHNILFVDHTFYMTNHKLIISRVNQCNKRKKSISINKRTETKKVILKRRLDVSFVKICF